MKNVINFARAKQNKEEEKYKAFEEESISWLENEEALFQKRLEEQEDNPVLKDLIREYKEKTAEQEAEVYQNRLLLDAGRITYEMYLKNIQDFALYGETGKLKQKLEEAFFMIYRV